MNIIGREIEVGVGLETVRGTPVAPSRWIKKISANVLPRNEKVVDESTFGGLEDSDNARVTKKWFDGDIEGNLHADVAGYFFLNLYGSIVTTGIGTGAYSHAFSLEQDIEHPTISVYRKDGSVINQKYGGGVVNTLEISATAGELVKFTSNIILSTGASSTETPAYLTEYDFIGRDITIKVADTEGGLAGATALTVKNVSISFSSNAIVDHKFGSYNPDIYNSAFGIEVSITKNMGDSTFETLFNADTYKYMQITIESEAEIATGKKASIVLTLNKAQVQSWERSGDANSLVEETIGLKAFYNATDGEASTLVLQNKTATLGS